MDLENVVARTEGLPATLASLTADLRTLGVRPGMTLIAHSALGRFGWVAGGPVAVILALEAALGPSGTLVLPTHSGDLSEPSYWRHPPVPEAWWPLIRAEMPAFDPDLTPTRGMGIIPETFRKQPDARRSGHPHVSFAAREPRLRPARPTTRSRPAWARSRRWAASTRSTAGCCCLAWTTVMTRRFTWPSTAPPSPASGPGGRARPCWWTAGAPGSSSMTSISTTRTSRKSGATLRGTPGCNGRAASRKPPPCSRRSARLVDYAVRWMEAHRGRDPAP